jgi:hypothetical protein
MNRNIAEFISNCSIWSTMDTALNVAKNYKWTKTFERWDGLQMEILGPINGTSLLLIIYTFSNWIELYHKKKSETPFTVIDLIDKIFVGRGILDLVATDNGPCFKSETTKLFFESYNIIYNRVKNLKLTLGHQSPVFMEESSVKLMIKFIVITYLCKLQQEKTIRNTS